MTHPSPPIPRGRRPARDSAASLALSVALSAALGACVLNPSPSPTASVATPTPSPTPTPLSSVTASASASGTPSATPVPSLALEPPAETDPRQVAVTVEPRLDGDSGELLVTVTSRADVRIDEVVLRWPTALGESLFLAPFVPSEERIRDGGPPLVQAWTKWVVGPGEQGEPAGTISLGYGPILSGTTLAIPIHAERRAPGPVAFDLQVLAGEALLTLEDGTPAQLRVEVP